MREISPFRRQLPYRFYNATLTLIIINAGFFLLMSLFRNIGGYLALTPIVVVRYRFYWQFVTYMFLHGNILHILFNMLALFIFGTQLEHRLGSSEFLIYYFLTGIGSGLTIFVVNLYLYGGQLAGIPVVGASGAIYGLLLAYATFFPNSMLYIFGILPLRAPVAVLLFAGLALYSQLTNTRVGVAHIAHLAGLVLGYLYILVRFRINSLRVFFKRR